MPWARLTSKASPWGPTQLPAGPVAPGRLSGVYHGKTIGKPWENGGLMVILWDLHGVYHLVMTNIAMENHHF